MGVIAALFTLAAVFTLFSVLAERRRQARLARGRRPTDPAAFLAALARSGVGEETGAFLLQEVSAYYLSPLTPEPHDRVFSTMRIDPGDIEDIAIRFCERFELPMPGRDDAATLPADSSLVELAQWLNRYRHAQATR